MLVQKQRFILFFYDSESFCEIGEMVLSAAGTGSISHSQRSRVPSFASESGLRNQYRLIHVSNVHAENIMMSVEYFQLRKES